MRVLVDSQKLTCIECSREGTKCTMDPCEGQVKTWHSNLMVDSEKPSEKQSILKVKNTYIFSWYT